MGFGRERGYSLVELLAAITITMFVMAGVYALMIQNQHVYEQQTRLADVQQAARVAIDLMTREIRMAGADPSDRTWAPDAACLDGTYKTPADATTPAPADIAPLTLATSTKIRIKSDRPTFALGPEPPPATPTPSPKTDRNSDGDYLEDDEDGLGDGFVNDEGEDVEYQWDSSLKRLYRIEYHLNPPSACRYAGAPTTATSTLPIAENVVNFELKYYDSDPPQSACPAATVYADEAAYETAKDACDPPLALPPPDYSAVRRVRIRLVVETEKADPLKPKVAPKYGKNWITLVSEATIRNRTF